MHRQIVWKNAGWYASKEVGMVPTWEEISKLDATDEDSAKIEAESKGLKNVRWLSWIPGYAKEV